MSKSQYFFWAVVSGWGGVSSHDLHDEPEVEEWNYGKVC